jgi:2-polyprenyl-3-methyl-5-hydroxy-6-metoxy-1,4-benzoquinol methylase
MHSCPICQRIKVTKIYNETLIECRNCSHIWADLSLDEEQMRNIYAENYFKGEEYADYLADKLILQTNFKNRLNYLKKLQSPPKFENVLEVGCAYGFFGELMLEKKSKYKGYDISEDAIEYANKQFGNNFSAQNYLLAEQPIEKYSDVFMWDVIEHLPNPSDFIKKISNETSINSRCYITTGDISTWLPRIQKDKWRMIHPPTHIHYFTNKSISNLLKQNGFKVEKISYPPVSRSFRVIFYSLFILNKNPGKIVTWFYNLIPEKASIQINTRDIMFVVGKKIIISIFIIH